MGKNSDWELVTGDWGRWWFAGVCFFEANSREPSGVGGARSQKETEVASEQKVLEMLEGGKLSVDDYDFGVFCGHKRVRVRKPHTCMKCLKGIEKSEYAVRESYSTGDEWTALYFHEDCHAAIGGEPGVRATIRPGRGGAYTKFK